jgi:hypothetical protein
MAQKEEKSHFLYTHTSESHVYLGATADKVYVPTVLCMYYHCSLFTVYCLRFRSLRSSQVGAIHPLYLYSAMGDMSLPTSSCGRRASAPTSQES